MQSMSGQMVCDRHVGELVAGRVVRQPLVLNGDADRLLLMFATFKRSNSCCIRVRLARDAALEDLVMERTLDASAVADNAWLELVLPTPLQCVDEQCFHVAIDSPSGRRGDAFTVRAGEPSAGSCCAMEGSRSLGLALACVLTNAPVAYAAKRAMFASRDRIRHDVGRSYLTGEGAEIGAGAFPSLLPDTASCRYFDLRTRSELVRYFGTDHIPLPDIEPIAALPTAFKGGAQFLIAHNVLEHCPDPLGTLIEWHRCLRPGAGVVLSVPQAGFGPDGNRLEVTIEHIVLDYALMRHADAFESREHCYSAMIGFKKGRYADMPRPELAEEVHGMAKSSGFDIHWHIFTPEVFAEMVRVAAALGGLHAKIGTIAHARSADESLRTEGEIIICYRIAPVAAEPAATPGVLECVRRQLVTAAERLLPAAS